MTEKTGRHIEVAAGVLSNLLHELLRDLGDVLRAQAELLQQVGGWAGVAELVVHADALDGHGALLCQAGANGLAQTADDGVLLHVNIARLRKKLDSFGLHDFITTRKGLGYVLEDEK